MDWQLLVSAVCAVVTAAVMVRYTVMPSFRNDRPMRGWFGIAMAVWLMRYAVSLIATATGWGWLSLVGNHNTIMTACVSIAIAAVAAIPDWRGITW